MRIFRSFGFDRFESGSWRWRGRYMLMFSNLCKAEAWVWKWTLGTVEAELRP
jgi:hypothetical protein